LVAVLKAWGYKAWYSVLDTKKHGIPQSRPRFYLVAILRHAYTHKFVFPPNIEPENLDLFLDKEYIDYETGPLKCLGGDHFKKVNMDDEKVTRGLNKLREKGADPTAETCVIDIGSSAAWAAVKKGCSLCLTKTHCRRGGHWLTTKHRTMTLREMARLQGLPPQRLAGGLGGASPAALAGALGNAMSINVLMRLLPGALWSAGLLGRKMKLPTEFASKLH
jgi:site-specific DNA-cytosine methylase